MNPQNIQAMPKAELHVHIESTMEPDLVRSLAERNGLQVPATAQDDKGGYAFQDLESFLSIYFANMDLLRTTRDFHDMCYAYLTRCKKLYIIHTEIFFDPQAHTSRGVPFKEMIEGLHGAIVKAQQELGVSALLIMNFHRDKDADSAMKTLEEAEPYKDWIVGVGLDSMEDGNPPNKFAAVFKRAREQGYKLTCHCDPDQPDAKEHIRQAIEDIGVDRIDHGINVLDDEKLVEAVVKRDLALTCCPLSYLALTGNSKSAKILELYRRGVRVTLNPDGPAYFRGYLNDNMARVISETGIKRSEVVGMQRNAFAKSWLGKEKFDRLIGTFNQWIISVELAG